MKPNNAALATSDQASLARDRGPTNGGRPGRRPLTMETRFGQFTFDPDNAVTMPNGLPGFPGEQDFALASFPDARLASFKLMQSLSDPELSFIVAPLNVESGIIAPNDVERLLDTLSIPGADAAFLLIVTVRKDAEEGVKVSGNLRAPVVVDTRTRLAHQYVMENDDYPIQHPLDMN